MVFQHYSTGIFKSDKCDSQKLSHALLAVGYDKDPKHGEYWIVKNRYVSACVKKFYKVLQGFIYNLDVTNKFLILYNFIYRILVLFDNLFKFVKFVNFSYLLKYEKLQGNDL